MKATTDLLLERARDGSLHHGLILQGTPTSVLQDAALRLAQTVNCPNGSTGDDCSSCSRIARGSHPDVHMLAVNDDRKMISIDQVRELVGQASMRPYEGRCKVFLIESAETMSPAAANSLLKTLEEPTSDTLFILSTRSADLLLPTIRSRCQIVSLRPIDSSPFTGKAQLRRLTFDATQGLLPPEAEEVTRTILERLRLFAEHNDIGALLSIAAHLAGGDSAAQSLAVLGNLLRDLASLEPAQSIDEAAFTVIQERIPRAALLRAASSSLIAGTRLVVNADARLLMERALVEVTKRGS
ncbi:MAG TPA: hypothetical protein VHL58_06825 [Thermoanaerobaculia bacterium]|nr:hypothetical protein [Thermoanaerobaculia bacterium]